MLVRDGHGLPASLSSWQLGRCRGLSFVGQREVLEEPQPCVRFIPCSTCWAASCVQAHMQYVQEHVDHGGISGALLHWLWRHRDGDTLEPRDKNRVRSGLGLQSLCRGRNVAELQMLLPGDASSCPASVHNSEVASQRVMDCYSCLPDLGVDTACSGEETSPTASPGLSNEGHPRAPGWFPAAEEEAPPISLFSISTSLSVPQISPVLTS